MKTFLENLFKKPTPENSLLKTLPEILTLNLLLSTYSNLLIYFLKPTFSTFSNLLSLLSQTYFLYSASFIHVTFFLLSPYGAEHDWLVLL